jgi:hypothetical protein
LESLLSSLFEVDEELPLSRELIYPSKPEILLDFELDDDEEDVAAASAASREAGRSSWFDGEPSLSITSAVCLMRAFVYKVSISKHCIVGKKKRGRCPFSQRFEVTSIDDQPSQKVICEIRSLRAQSWMSKEKEGW